jgi:hypothetical protein
VGNATKSHVPELADRIIDHATALRTRQMEVGDEVALRLSASRRSNPARNSPRGVSAGFPYSWR